MQKLWICLLLFSIPVYSCQKPGTSGTQGSSGKGTGETSLSSGITVSKAGSYSLEVSGTRQNTVFTATSRNFNLASVKITWLINGQPVPDIFGPQLKASSAKRGDVVQASATVDGVSILSNSIEIKNRPPEISSVKLLPETFKPGDALSVDVTARDVDGDNVSISYEWNVNGQPAGTGQRLEIMPKRGDKISVKVVPFDGTDYGNAVIMEKTVLNLPPMIIENNEFTFDGKMYTCQVKATDPDGDVLRYSLETSPNGMTIDPSTGVIKWPVPPEFKGEVGTTVVVDDGHGGTARYNLKITIP